MQAELSLVGTYLNEAIDQLRLLSRSLNSEYVSSLGLRKAIDIELGRQQRLGKFSVDWKSDDHSSSLDNNQELVAFRIFQEAVHNAIRHSRAKNLKVQLTFEPSFQMQIADDGVGFHFDNTIKSDRASGIRNIVRRASMAGFNCVVDTRPGFGCRYTLDASPKTTF
jgi:signal transduction histidine kinase